jgi:hypothetical protein
VPLFARLYMYALSTKQKKSFNSQLCFSRRTPIHRWMMEFVWRGEGFQTTQKCTALHLQKWEWFQMMSMSHLWVFVPPTPSIRPLLEFNTVDMGFNPSTH